MEMPPGVDDESMMGLAIALSLQDQPEGQAQGLNLQGLAIPASGASNVLVFFLMSNFPSFVLILRYFVIFLGLVSHRSGAAFRHDRVRSRK